MAKKEIEVEVTEEEALDLFTKKDWNIILEALDFAVKGGGIQVAKEVLPIVEKIQKLK